MGLSSFMSNGLFLMFSVTMTRDLTIRNFQYKEGASGRYTVHIDSPYIGNELLSMYNENVSKVCIKLESSQFADFTLSNSSQNSITLKSQECDFWSIVNLLKVYL